MGLTQVLHAVATKLYFLFAHDDKSQPAMERLTLNTSAATPLLADRAYKSTGGFQGFILDIMHDAGHLANVDYYDALLACQVVSVRHMRSDEKQHEIVVVEYRREDENGRVDTRFMRMERMKDVVRGDSRLDWLSNWKEDAVRVDGVLINETLEQVASTSYEVAQALDGISGLNVLHIIGFGSAISQFAERYSVFGYMCMWYAAALFRMVKDNCPRATHVAPSPNCNAGKFVFPGLGFGYPLVNLHDASLRWPAEDKASHERIRSALTVILDSGAIRTEAAGERALEALEQDARHSKDCLVQIVATARYLLPELHGEIRRRSLEIERMRNMSATLEQQAQRIRQLEDEQASRSQAD